jgi:hypothetical protein
MVAIKGLFGVDSILKIISRKLNHIVGCNFGTPLKTGLSFTIVYKKQRGIPHRNEDILIYSLF